MTALSPRNTWPRLKKKKTACSFEQGSKVVWVNPSKAKLLPLPLMTFTGNNRSLTPVSPLFEGRWYLALCFRRYLWMTDICGCSSKVSWCFGPGRWIWFHLLTFDFKIKVFTHWNVQKKKYVNLLLYLYPNWHQNDWWGVRLQYSLIWGLNKYSDFVVWNECEKGSVCDRCLYSAEVHCGCDVSVSNLVFTLGVLQSAFLSLFNMNFQYKQKNWKDNI